MKKLQILSLIIFLFTLSSSVFAEESNLEKGWEYFKTNDYEKAREYFNLAIKENDSSVMAEANLAMSMMAVVDERSGDAFQYCLFYFKSLVQLYSLKNIWKMQHKSIQ